MNEPSLQAAQGAGVNSGSMAIEELRASLETLASKAGADRLSGLQDASLLLLESLNDRLSSGVADDQETLALIGAWPQWDASYRRDPFGAATGIVQYLRSPALRLPLADDEYGIVESMLLEDAANLPESAPEDAAPDAIIPPSPSPGPLLAPDHHLAILEKLAGQAGADGLQAWQDACLLLVDTLNDRLSTTGTPESEIWALLDAWILLDEAYRANPLAAAPDILNILRHPALSLPLADDEFALVEEMLRAQPITGPCAEEPDFSVDPTPPAQVGDEISEHRRQQCLSEMPKKQCELVELLLMQADLVTDTLHSAAEGDESSRAMFALDAAEHLERFTGAAATVGFAGLARMCALVDENIRKAATENPLPSREFWGLLIRWVEGVKRYLLEAADVRSIDDLIQLLLNPSWPTPIEPESLALLSGELGAINPDAWQDDAPARAQLACEDDVSLHLPDDVNLELLDILLQELPVQARRFSESIQSLGAGGTLQDIDTAQRVAHTLKGSANTVGVRGIAVLTHQLEDILVACATAQRMPNSALLQVLQEAADCLEGMSEALSERRSAPPDALGVLQTLLDWANRIDSDGLPAGNEAILSEPKTALPAPAKGEEPRAGESTPDPAATVRVPSELIGNLFRLSGESIILNAQAEERLRRMKLQIQAMQTQFELLKQLGTELDALIDLGDFSGGDRPAGRKDAADEFDALEMEQYNELHTASRRMVEAAFDMRELSLDAGKELMRMDGLLESQRNLAIDIQSAAMETRLVPVSSIVSRLERSLRQTCRLTGKSAVLAVAGGDLRIDGDTLTSLVDPLMHVLRNAVDHGLEHEQERLGRNKPAQGNVTVEFETEGNHIVVRCRDDGRGLDFEAIRAAAEQRGWLKAGEEISDEALQTLILQPNFSTRTESTQTSGRGVGMDVVRAQVVALGGTLKLQSKTGAGLTVEMRVPLPLSRTHALLALVGRQPVVIGNKGYSQVFYSGAGELRYTEEGEFLSLDGQLYPAVRLGELLRFPGYRPETPPHGAILLVEVDEQLTAVLVDAVTDSRDVVIMGMGRYLSKIPGVMGATILGDGTVAPVVNVPELLGLPAVAVADMAAETFLDLSPSTPLVLVVDDSLSNRRSLEQLLTDAGFRVSTASDGVDAAESLAGSMPDIVLTDLEMPRMNGIELTSHIRALASGKALPIIMITSRTTQRHRQLAYDAGVDFYLTKPVREDELLDRINGLLGSIAGRERVN